MDGVRMVFLLHLVVCVAGKHLPRHVFIEEKSYRRQMIIPNKFIPILKESSLFKSRSSSNDLSSFLKPKSHKHDSETGQTRQNLMSSLGMDSSQSPGMGYGAENGGGGTEGETGMGGMRDGGEMGGIGEGGGMGGIRQNGGIGSMSQMGGADEAGGMGGMAGMQGNGEIGGMSEQMNSMNGMENSDAQQSPLEGIQNSNGMNSMNNGEGQSMNSDPYNPPAGDPMGTLKDMLSSQATNTALGTNSEAFGPGGSANSNVLAMLNQIVGKEMPGESPVDPSSKQQQVWDQLQRNFNRQKPSGIPYIDSDNSKSASDDNVQPNSVTSSNQTTNAAAQPVSKAPAPTTSNPSVVNTSTTQPSSSNPSAASPSTGNPITNPTSKTQPLVSNPSAASTLNGNPTATNPSITHTSLVNPSTSNPAPSTNSNTKALHSEKESHTKALAKTTQNVLQAQEEDEDQPLSADMVKFLKGVKFVVSQEPGNDIILGKKFSSGLPPSVTDSLEEENGVMKNVVSLTDNQVKNSGTRSSTQDEKLYNTLHDNMGANTDLMNYAGNKDFVEYVKAAKILENASKKLNDPVAKKSTEIAIASIIKVVALGDQKNISSSNVDLLNGGDVKNKLSEKYIEAARVLGTASKKLVDPVARKSTEIGIASILKIIALGRYPTTKKAFVPGLYRGHLQFVKNMNADGEEKYENVASDLDAAVKRTLLNFPNIIQS